MIGNGLLFVMLCLFLFGCAGRDTEAQRQAAVAATVAKLRSCMPDGETEGDLKLAVASVTRQANETNVRLVAYALHKPAEFDLPAYSLSRGRWLIHETERAYLLDEQCREYKLKERTSSIEVPPNGKISLEAGRVFETTLSFPPLPDAARIGVLVYGRQVLPFLLNPSAQR
ncbi:MAG: hypothetical protein ABI977_26875 [Acidobacteriota bacterium]